MSLALWSTSQTRTGEQSKAKHCRPKGIDAWFILTSSVLVCADVFRSDQSSHRGRHVRLFSFFQFVFQIEAGEKIRSLPTRTPVGSDNFKPSGICASGGWRLRGFLPRHERGLLREVGLVRGGPLPKAQRKLGRMAGCAGCPFWTGRPATCVGYVERSRYFDGLINGKVRARMTRAMVCA
jgi:hypothetical protein